MSDKDMLENDQLDEFKASFGDPSEVPEPSTKETPKRTGDKDVEDDPKDAPTAVKVPKTKAGMINAMMQKMNAMKTKDLMAMMGAMGKNNQVPGMNEDTDFDEEVASVRALPKITSEDIDISEDVNAMFADDSLSEEFVERATTVFEAAVVSKVNEQLEKISTNFEAELSEEIEKLETELSEKLDSYLDYVVEQWMSENQLAVEQGIKAEMVENFIGGLKDLFEEHYVEIPDEKVDVVEELAAKAEELESRLDEEISKNVELKKVAESFTKDKLIESVAEDLTDTQKAKFKTLAEGIDYTDQESYVEKIEVIKESYFGASDESTIGYDFDDNEPLEEEVSEQKPSDPSMAVYLDAISRSIKK